MSSKGTKEKNKSDISSTSEQNHIGQNAINTTSSSQDKYETHNETHIHNPVFVITSDDKPILQQLTQLITLQQPKLHASVEDDDKLKEQTKTWEETDGVFSLVEDLKSTIQTLDVVRSDVGRSELSQLLEPIIELVENADKMHIINAIKVVAKEDEIDKTKEQEKEAELQQELGGINVMIDGIGINAHTRYKKIYNLIRSKDLQNRFLMKLEEIEEETKDPHERKSKFLKYWNNILTYHPSNVFFSSEMGLKEQENACKKQIYERLKSGRRVVFLFSRGKKANEICANITQEIVNEYKNVRLKEDSYHIAKITAKKFTFINEIMTIKDFKDITKIRNAKTTIV